MSQAYYQEQWKKVQNNLKKTLAADSKIKRKGPYKDLDTVKWLIGHLFMNYVQIVNRLDECYDQMIHPQKREVIGRLLDMSLGRLLELKSELVRIELDDYIFFDNVLIELKLTHQDVEIHIPQYFWRNQEKAKAHRRALIKWVFEEAEKEKFKAEYLKNVPAGEREEVWEKYQIKELKRLGKEVYKEHQKKAIEQTMHEKNSIEKLKDALKQGQPLASKESIVEAITLIQRHERARQGRFRTTLAKRKKALKEMGEMAPKISEEEAESAAKVIQCHWRRHWRRCREAKAMMRLQEMLGMMPYKERDMEKYRKLEIVAKLRRKMQERNQLEYEESFDRAKIKVARWYTIPMEEDTVDEIMAWFKWYFEQCGYLPDFPPEKPIIPTGDIMGIPKKLGPNFAEKLFPPASKKQKKLVQPPPKMSALAIALSGISAIGGSALVVADHWIAPTEFLRCQQELEKMKKDKKPAGAAPKKLTKEEKLEMKKKQKELEKKLRLAEEAEGFRLRESSYIVPLNKADHDYRMIWMDRDESKNPDQRYIYEFVKDDKCCELSMEVRREVDKMMILELDILKEALDRDKNPKKKPKKKKPKKEKKPTKKKGKKDPTGDRTLDDLFMELFRNGIIRDYEEVKLKDYLGERSYAAFDMKQRLIDWPPSTGDVRDLIIQLCILPLGSSNIHQLSPLIKSVCLLGTENSGKEFLARIICTETASVLFDLTPANVAGKYPGKSGLKMLQHLVEKMSRALQPSVIFIDGAEKTFYKKVPKEDKFLDPKRLAGMLKKVVKGIKSEDQVLLLGVSSQPWMAKKGKFLKTYQKTIQVPQMDYASYMMLWQRLLEQFRSIPGDFDVSCLARTSDGFSTHTITDAVKNVLTLERISRSRLQPYNQLEFMEELLKTTPTDPKIIEKSLKFYSGLEMPKKRAKKLMEMKTELEKSQKKQ